MRGFVDRHPIWSVVIFVIAAVLLWMIFAIWPDWLKDLIGRKKVFVNALFNGITLGGLYFLVASGFTLIFGLMRNVNLAHGSLYLLGGYIGYLTAETTGYWLLAFPVAFIVVGAFGVLLQVFVFRRMEGEDLRQTLVTIGISIVMADLMLWIWGGDFYNISPPEWLSGPMKTFIVTTVKRSGDLVYLKYPFVRIVIFAASVVVGVGNRTRDLHEALRRRCVYHWIDYPDPALEAEIVMTRASSVARSTADAVVASVGRLRTEPLAKPPGVAETIEWAEAATLLHSQGNPWPQAFLRSIGVALKDHDDLDYVAPFVNDVLPGEAA